jgi:outer membrane protein insertion porin family
MRAFLATLRLALPLVAVAALIAAPHLVGAQPAADGETGAPEGRGALTDGSAASADGSGVTEGSGHGVTFENEGSVDVVAQATDSLDAVITGLGRTVTRVEVVCDLVECESEQFVEALVRLGGIESGDVLDEAILVRALGRLLETGYFVDARVETVLDQDGVLVRLVTTGATIIEDINLHTGLALAREIRRRIFLRPGEIWTGEQEAIDRQIRVILEYFENQGVFGSRVSLRSRSTGPGRVEVNVRVRRGSRRTVDNLYVRGNENLAYATIRDAALDAFNLRRSFSATVFERAADAVVGLYRDRGFLQARVSWDSTRTGDQPDSVDLFLEIDEGPRWDVRFRGNRVFTDRELRDRVTFYDTGFIDEAEVDIAVGEIRNLYETAGHYFANITALFQQDESGTNRVWFEIDEGPTSEVRSISFVGMEALSEEEVVDAIGTNVWGILESGGYLQRAQLGRDIQTILELYRVRGYLHARIPRVVMVGEDGGRDLHLSVFVEEGEPVTVEAVEVVGETEIWRDARRRLELRPGDPFTEAAVAAASGVISDAHFERGYASVRVAALCVQPDGTEVDCARAVPPPGCALAIDRDRELACQRTFRGGAIIEECRTAEVGPTCMVDPGIVGDSVVVRLSIDTGDAVTFGDTFVRGNFRTRRRILARELTFRAGEPFNYQQLFESQSRVRSLSLFDAVRVRSIGTDNPALAMNEVPVVVQVEEAPSRFLDHRLSMEARVTSRNDLLFILSNEPTLRDINILGRGEEVRLGGNFDIDTLNPARTGDGEFRGGVTLQYIDPRTYLGGLLEDPWESRIEFSYSHDHLAVAPAPQVDQVALGIRVRDESDVIRGLLFELGASVRSSNTLDQRDETLVQAGFERSLVLSLTPRVTLERRDNPLNPTRGSYTEGEIEIADDILGVLNAEKFTRFEAHHSQYTPLGDVLMLATNARLGFAVGGIIDGFKSRDRFALPVADRFSLGGVTSLRGFAERSITSTSTDEFGGDILMNGALELRYPFVPSWGVYGATFVDAGQLAADFSDISLDGFRLTGGVGLRILIADILPLVVDYGAVLNRRPGEGFGRLHFNIGYTF